MQNNCLYYAVYSLSLSLSTGNTPALMKISNYPTSASLNRQLELDHMSITNLEQLLSNTFSYGQFSNTKVMPSYRVTTWLGFGLLKLVANQDQIVIGHALKSFKMGFTAPVHGRHLSYHSLYAFYLTPSLGSFSLHAGQFPLVVSKSPTLGFQPTPVKSFPPSAFHFLPLHAAVPEPFFLRFDPTASGLSERRLSGESAKQAGRTGI